MSNTWNRKIPKEMQTSKAHSRRNRVCEFSCMCRSNEICIHLAEPVLDLFDSRATLKWGGWGCSTKPLLLFCLSSQNFSMSLSNQFSIPPESKNKVFLVTDSQMYLVLLMQEGWINSQIGTEWIMEDFTEEIKFNLGVKV